MIAGITAHTISIPRGECGIGAGVSVCACGAKAARRIASSATMQRIAAIQNMSSFVDWLTFPA